MSCIQLKLQDSVTDSTLRKIDEWKIHVNSPDIGRQIEIHVSPSGQTIPCRIVGNGQFYSDSSFTTPIGTSVTLTSGTWVIYAGAGNYDIYLGNKYNVSYIKSLPTGINQGHQMTIDGKLLGYENNWLEVDLVGVNVLNFTQLAINKLYALRLTDCNLNCTIDEICAALSPSVNFGRFVLNQDDTITGDASNLGNLPIWNNADNGTYVSVWRKSDTQSLSGTYQAFCDKLYASGKTSGTLYVLFPDDPTNDYTLVTFNSEGWVRS